MLCNKFFFSFNWHSNRCASVSVCTRAQANLREIIKKKKHIVFIEQGSNGTLVNECSRYAVVE